MSVAEGIDLSGLAQAERAIRRFTNLDFDELLDVVGATVEFQVRTRIEEQQGQPNGEPWEPLSDSYKARKEKISSGGILQLHGDLVDTMTYDVGSYEVEVGSNRIYAATMQMGDDRLAWGRVQVHYPARPFLGLNSDNEDMITEAIESWFDKEFKS